jgi:two-component system, NarL family, nitrate/nitrite response regulator NarL
MQVTCLIVDDNALFLEAASALLTRGGLDVVGVASNSADALRLVAQLQPDVTLVDVDLGDEDGFELTCRLSDAGSKVILVSTHAEVDLAPLIAESPALAFVSKTRLSAQAVHDALERAA